MALSSDEQRASAEMDRVLSRDPVLAAVADLFAQPARPVPFPSLDNRRSAPRRAAVAVLGVLVLVVVLAGSYLAAAFGHPANSGRVPVSRSASQSGS